MTTDDLNLYECVKTKCDNAGLALCTKGTMFELYRGESFLFAARNIDELNTFLCGLRAAAGQLFDL